MNTNQNPHHDTSASPKFSELHPESVTPRELVRFPGNPISEAYYPCPAPTTPGVTILEDLGMFSLVHIQKPSGSFIFPRPNEAVPMPRAYVINEMPEDVVFQCVFEFGGELFHSLGCLPDDGFGFWETFAENIGTATERLSPLGIDMLMRYATSSADLYVPIRLNKTSSGVEHYRANSHGIAVAIRRHLTPEGDCWTSTIGNGHAFELITHTNELG